MSKLNVVLNKSASAPRLRGKSSPSERLSFIEGLRGLAALYVVLGHLCSMSDPSFLAGKASAAPIWFQRVTAPFSYGHLAVAAFIVISGFCLQLSLFRSGDGRIGTLRAFFVRRARRILPAYYACLGISTFVAVYVTAHLKGLPFGLYLPVTPQIVAAHVLMIHNLSPGWMYKINGVLWSIGIEAQLYLLFPLIVAGLFRVGRWWTLVASSLAAVALISVAPKLYPWYLPLFVAGMCAAHLAYRPHRILGQATFISRLIAIGAAWVCFYGIRQGWSIPAQDAMAGVFVAAVCYGCSILKSSPVSRLLSVRPLAAVGVFSYSLYLIHNPIQQVLYFYRPVWGSHSIGCFFYLLLTMPIILVASWGFSLLFERPFISRKATSPQEAEGFVPTSLPLRTAVGDTQLVTAARVAKSSGGAESMRVAVDLM